MTAKTLQDMPPAIQTPPAKERAREERAERNAMTARQEGVTQDGLPWTAHESGFIHDSNGRVVCDGFTRASLVVQYVNAHSQLTSEVARLSRALRDLRIAEQYDDDDPRLIAARAQADTALGGGA